MNDTIILCLCIILFVVAHELIRRTALRHIKESNTPNIITDNHPSNLHQYPFVGFRGANTQDNQLSLYRKSQEILLNYTIQDTSVRCEETELDDFISSSAKICCIEGDDGTGKSTLLANWLKDRIARELPNETIIYHFYNIE